MKFPIFLDNHSTTPMDPEVLQAMLPYFSEKFGNASSRSHVYGWSAEIAVETAREQIAAMINAKPGDIFFTSGATESNNLALQGSAQTNPKNKNHFITSAVEHASILQVIQKLRENKSEITILPVNADGKIDLRQLEESITPQTALMTFLAANNEIGTINPLEFIGKIAKDHQVLFHVDAAQAFGKIPLDVKKMNIDFMSLTAHKIYGPKGVGALYVKDVSRIGPLFYGGQHEKGLRPGTLNVPGIVGLGAAADLCFKKMESEFQHIKLLRDDLQNSLIQNLGQISINGEINNRLPNNLNISFKGIEAGHLLENLRNIAISLGSACSSGSSRPSHVLEALGLPQERIISSIRIGLGRFTTGEEIQFAKDEIIKSVLKLRNNKV
jgi:cysteine desulfurase